MIWYVIPMDPAVPSLQVWLGYDLGCEVPSMEVLGSIGLTSSIVPVDKTKSVDSEVFQTRQQICAELTDYYSKYYGRETNACFKLCICNLTVRTTNGEQIKTAVPKRRPILPS